MKIALITDAWQPQVNGVVTTLVELVRELESAGHSVAVIHPGLFKTWPCPGYAGIDLAVRPKAGLTEKMDAFQPEMIHVATEGPLGWAARSYCIKNGLRFTTAFHTKFPEILNAALKIPLSWGYAVFLYFHKASAGVMVPTHGVLRMLEQRGFRNLRSWTHGVDTQLFAFEPQPKPKPYPPMGGAWFVRFRFLLAVFLMKKISRHSLSWTFPVPKSFAVWVRWRHHSRSVIRRSAGWVCCRARSWPGFMPPPMCLTMLYVLRNFPWRPRYASPLHPEIAIKSIAKSA